jgi:DNA-binding CsgD family transcriptional regulator
LRERVVTLFGKEKILDLIYDAASESDLWSQVLTEIADLTGSAGGILFGQSVTASKVYFDFNGRLSEECNRAYQDRHMINPWSESMENRPVGKLFLSDDIVDLSTLRSTFFYDEVLRPQNIAHNGMVALAAKEDFRAAFNICRTTSQGPFGADERGLLEQLIPHLRRSILLGFRLDTYQALQNSAFNALEQLSDGVVLLDRNAQIIFANAAARASQAEGSLRLPQSLLTYSSSFTQRLAALIKIAVEGEAGGSMSMPTHADGHLLTILVSSVRGKDIGRLADLGMKDAAALVFIIDPARTTAIPLARIMDAYGLTRAEAKVALAAAAGNTIAETARLLTLSPNTIKTHLRKVFAKTSTRRQTELAKLMASVDRVRTADGAV